MDNLKTENSSRGSYLVPLAIVVAGLLVAGAVWLRGSGNIDTTAAVGGKPVKVDLGNLPALGEAKAEIPIVVFGDYQCPSCEQFFKTSESLIREQYVKNGEVKVAWRDFAFLGPESFWAAEAARCANDQGQFWQYHDLLFNRQSGENKGAFAKDKLKGLAGELGLNQGDFDACLDSDKYAPAIKNDTDYGRSIGVDATPFIFVAGEKIVGAQPFSFFDALIKKHLK